MKPKPPKKIRWFIWPEPYGARQIKASIATDSYIILI